MTILFDDTDETTEEEWNEYSKDKSNFPLETATLPNAAFVEFYIPKCCETCFYYCPLQSHRNFGRCLDGDCNNPKNTQLPIVHGQDVHFCWKRK